MSILKQEPLADIHNFVKQQTDSGNEDNEETWETVNTKILEVAKLQQDLYRCSYDRLQEAVDGMNKIQQEAKIQQE